MSLPPLHGDDPDSLKKVKVAAVQFESQADPATNLHHLRSLRLDASLEGASVIVLPEAAQRAFGTAPDPLTAQAESLEGPFVGGLVEVAEATGSVLVAGMFEESGDPQRPFNTTVVADENGVVATYRKIHLYDALGVTESDWVTPGEAGGENLVTFVAGGATFGVLTCFDLRFPELARSLAVAGAEVLCVGAAWNAGKAKRSQWEILTSARAIESTCYLVAAAQPSPRFCGTSRILDLYGAPLAQAGEDGEAIVTAELDLEALAKIRVAMPVLSSLRFETHSS